jgi:hypothetical protein
MARPIHDGNLPRLTSWGLEVANSTSKESGKSHGKEVLTDVIVAMEKPRNPSPAGSPSEGPGEATGTDEPPALEDSF